MASKIEYFDCDILDYYLFGVNADRWRCLLIEFLVDQLVDDGSLTRALESYDSQLDLLILLE